MSATASWGSRLGFILASAGSAVGLGAIWKFPYMSGSNGGAAFMIPYILFTLTIGVAMLRRIRRGPRGPGRRRRVLKEGRGPLVGYFRLYRDAHGLYNPLLLLGRGRLVP